MSKIDHLIETLKTKYNGSSFSPISQNELEQFEKRVCKIPDDLRYLYLRLGHGTIGRSRYAIHFLFHPEDIYDQPTAKELDGIIIVGDDFAGNCEAYDTKNQWRFGSIGSNGVFQPYENKKSFIDFLTEWYAS